MLLRWLILCLSLLPVQAAWGLTSISVFKTFTAEILTVADLNSSFTRLLDDGINPLIVMHPGDSTSTVRGIHDSLDARTTGNNIGIVRSLVFRDQDDSLVVGGTAILDTARIRDSLTVVTGARATIPRARIDTLLIGSATPTVGFTGGMSPAGNRFTFASLVRLDSVRTDCLTVAGPGSFSGSVLPFANNGAAIGSATVSWADAFLATGGVINWANGEITITETDANTLTIAGVATLLDLAAGILEVNNAVRFDTGVAMVAAAYAVGRDADATNQLHFNVPTGATFEWSINDALEAILTPTGLGIGISPTTGLDVRQAADGIGNGIRVRGTAGGTTGDFIEIYIPSDNTGSIQGRLDGGSTVMDIMLNPEGGNIAIGTTAADALGLRILKASANVGISLERTTDVASTGSMLIEGNGDLLLQSETGTSAIYLPGVAATRNMAFYVNGATRMVIRPAGDVTPFNTNKLYDMGQPANAWDDCAADDFLNEADFYFFDDRDDLAAIKKIRGSGKYDAIHGYELIDDASLPEWALRRSKKDIYDDQGLRHAKGEIMRDPVTGNPFLSMKTMLSWHQGALRQAAVRIEELEREVGLLKARMN